jgi:hypothetical protein
MTVFDYADFQGRGVVIEGDVSNLDQIGFNDRIYSLVVEQGSWQLCEHADFRGACVSLEPGRYPNMGELRGKLSSVRVLPPAGGRIVSPVQSPSRGALVLYGQQGLQGRSIAIDSAVVRNLADLNFNDRASSVRIESGYWMLCSDANFEGECRTFGPGDYGTLPPELQNRVSSARRISNQYPYREQPRWPGR